MPKFASSSLRYNRMRRLPILWGFTIGVMITLTSSSHAVKPPIHNETVMSPGMKITAKTPVGTIAITARENYVRSYTWEGATRSVEMDPRVERWYGSLGLYYPGAGEHWDEHHGITRGVLEEGQQHFKTANDALHWLHARDWLDYVYRDDGLVVGWSKTLPRKQLNVEVWQLFVLGKKPKRLNGSQNARIQISKIKTETNSLVIAVQQNDLRTITKLLCSGSDPNVKNSIGLPVLVLAVNHSSMAVVNLLLEGGADANVRGDEGSTPLIVAVMRDKPGMVKSLLSRQARVNDGLSKGLVQGMTPLMIAAMGGQISILKMLLANGADLKARDHQINHTALQWGEDHPEVVRLLKQAGAKD